MWNNFFFWSGCINKDVTCGNTIVGCGTTKQFITGDWTNVAPVIDEEKCKQCLCHLLNLP